MDIFHVVFATDENYVQHAGVTMLSLLENKKSANPITINIIDDGLTEDSRNKLRKIAIDYRAALSFLYIKTDNLLNILAGRKRTMFYRLAIPDLLPDIDKALYLDVDLIVRHDISELWATDISNYYLAAVNDIADKEDLERLKRDLGIPDSQPYLNSGVLLINNRKWREEQIGEKIVKYVFEHKPLQEDQDGLNAILWGKWLPLNPKWNIDRQAFRHYCHFSTRAKLPEEVKKAVKDPAIVHFTGPVKPWYYACAVPFAEEYYSYLSLTPWRDYRPKDINLRNRIKKYWKRLRYILLMR